MVPSFHYWVDSPAGTEAIRTPYLLVSGWIAFPVGSTLSRLRLAWNGATFPLEQTNRPDVKQAHPGLASCGFQGLYALGDAPEGAAHVCFDLDGGEQQFPVPIRIDPESAVALAAAKARKAEVIRPLLACPNCRGNLSSRGPWRLVCETCGAAFEHVHGAFDFLPESLRSRHKVSATSNISAWGYDEKATALIERFKGGVILDCGCGLRPAYLDNVVNFEIADYPTTDVLGVGQALPFKDESFDAVFSFAVLEHVTDPFACADELVRVLKPGATLFAVVPFLQPFHGYPDHYYNMSSSGLKTLFADKLQILECAVPETGLPIYSLVWFLNSYFRGLDPGTAAHFAEMRVKDLLAAPTSYLQSDIVRKLSAAANEELASTNYLVAEKPR